MRVRYIAISAVFILFVSSVSLAQPVPVGAWYADGNASDQFGAVNGTLTGTTTYAAGKYGQAFSFDGGGLVKLPNNAFDSLSGGDITIAAWLKTNQGSDYTAVEFEENWMLYFDSAQPGVPAPLWDGDYHVRLQSGVDIRDGQWHHVASVYQSGLASVYVDGVFRASGLRGIANGTIDQFGGGYFNNYVGLLDEVAIFNRALSSAEINSFMNHVPEPNCLVLVAGVGCCWGSRRNRTRA